MKTKKIMASLLAAGMILSISACSNNTENTTVVTDSISTDIYYEETEEPSGTLDDAQESEIIDAMGGIFEESEETIERSSDEEAIIEIPRGDVSEADVNEFLSSIPDYWVVGNYQTVYSDDYVTVSAMPLYISDSISDVSSTWPMIIWKTENHCDFTISVDGNGEFQTDRGLTEGMGNHFCSEVEPGAIGYTCTDFQTVEGGSGDRADDGIIYMYDVINEVYFSADIESYDPEDGYEDLASSQVITVDFSVLGTPDYSN